MVNDGSTDGSREVALRYVEQYPYMKYIEQPNGGVSVARNSGMERRRQVSILLFVTQMTTICQIFCRNLLLW